MAPVPTGDILKFAIVEIPVILNDVPTIRAAVKIPETNTSPTTVSFDVGVVVPIPTLSVLISTYRLLAETKLAVSLVLFAITGF